MSAIVVTQGVLGWGNRKSGLEPYGPGGRWDTTRQNPGHTTGDLLGDHLDDLGVREGAHLIVVAVGFDATLADRLAAEIRQRVDELHREMLDPGTNADAP